jgi:hypothetical protein
MAHLVMLVIFYVNAIACQFFNLSHIYSIFVEKTHFWDGKFQISHMISNIMVQTMWNDIVQYTFNCHKN